MFSDYHGVNFYREGQIAAFIVRHPDGKHDFVQNPKRRDFARVAIQYGLNYIDYYKMARSAAEQGAATILWDIETMLKSQTAQEEPANDAMTMIMAYSDDTQSVYAVNAVNASYYDVAFGTAVLLSESVMIEFMTSEQMFDRRILFEVEVKYS